MKLIITIALLAASLIACKPQESTLIGIKNSDDFSNKNYIEDYNTYLNYLSTTEYVNSIKILYNKKVFSFEEYKKEIGFKEEQKVEIIKDSNAIAKYAVEDCEILIVVKDK